MTGFAWTNHTSRTLCNYYAQLPGLQSGGGDASQLISEDRVSNLNADKNRIPLGIY